MTDLESLIEHHLIKTNGVTLHVVTAGPADGQPVVLLHGFPEFWYGWKHQIPALAQAGYRVIVPDQRGYNQSDKPAGLENYTIDKLTGDIVGLIEHFGYTDAFIVGHDWGAMVAWSLGLYHPQRVRRLVTMNVPHPVVFSRTLRGSVGQMLKSWYVAFFQIPAVPEFMLSLGGYSVAANAIKSSGKPSTFSDAEMVKYKEAWAREGAVTGMLNWYRAYAQKPPARAASIRLAMPTLLIWGKNDVALSHEMAQPSIDLCDDGQLVLIDDATHWVQHDAPERVNGLLLDFLGRG
jgi:pimeloyl-ACP methyl ester carboxylesterase